MVVALIHHHHFSCLPLPPLYTSLNNFLPGESSFLFSSLLPSWLVSSVSANFCSFFCFVYLLSLSPSFSPCLPLLPRSFSRYIFSRGSVHFGISLRAAVHQCRSARTLPERLRRGYCHCGTIITSAVRQTAVRPHTHTHAHTHTHTHTHLYRLL